jgi:hypothetical protein
MEDETGSFYTVLGVREDGAIPVVELLACDADATALERAVSWLAAHASCTRAEVWRDSELIGEVAPRNADLRREATLS